MAGKKTKASASEKAKKFNIVVQGQKSVSKVTPADTHEYYDIRAMNEDEAREQALEVYRNSNPGVEVLSAARKRRMNIAAIIFMSIAILLSFIPWYTESGKIEFSLKPSMFSTLLGIALYSAVILRVKGLHNSFNSFSQGLLSILTIIFCSSFLNFFVGDIKITIFGIKALVISGKAILALGIIFSWLGMSAIVGFVWVILFILAVSRLILGDAVMGFWGNIYVLSAFLGIVFQLKQQSTDFLQTLGRDMASIGARTKHTVIRDIGNFSDATKKAIKKNQQTRSEKQTISQPANTNK